MGRREDAKSMRLVRLKKDIDIVNVVMAFKDMLRIA